MTNDTDWWAEHLEHFRHCGRESADKGAFDPPHSFDLDDPQNEAENGAYKDGFLERRKELGDKFEWMD